MNSYPEYLDKLTNNPIFIDNDTETYDSMTLPGSAINLNNLSEIKINDINPEFMSGFRNILFLRWRGLNISSPLTISRGENPEYRLFNSPITGENINFSNSGAYSEYTPEIGQNIQWSNPSEFLYRILEIKFPFISNIINKLPWITAGYLRGLWGSQNNTFGLVLAYAGHSWAWYRGYGKIRATDDENKWKGNIKWTNPWKKIEENVDLDIDLTNRFVRSNHINSMWFRIPWITRINNNSSTGPKINNMSILERVDFYRTFSDQEFTTETGITPENNPRLFFVSSVPLKSEGIYKLNFANEMRGSLREDLFKDKNFRQYELWFPPRTKIDNQGRLYPFRKGTQQNPGFIKNAYLQNYELTVEFNFPNEKILTHWVSPPFKIIQRIYNITNWNFEFIQNNFSDIQPTKITGYVVYDT